MKKSILLFVQFILDIIASIVLFLFVPGMVFVYIFIGSPVEISGSAMDPNYKNGQYYFVNKIAYRSENPQRGDVVVFKHPLKPHVNYVNRVIALPGETVELIGG